MPNALEVTKRLLYSEAYTRYESESIAIEDCRFLNFTEFLDEIDVFKNPTVSRSNGIYKNGKWSILGYSTNSFRQMNDEENTDVEDEEENNLSKNDSFEIKWEYTLFNGFFTDDVNVIKASKQAIDKSINETVRFLEKTFSKEFINDVSEARDLQDQIIKQYNQNNLERIDICIITDTTIDQEKLPSKVSLKNTDIQCRVYYWDLKRWNELKRSKSKREPIDIDFSTDDYESYNIPYLKQSTNDNITYYLAIFPGDLIADLYDLHNTRLLENNVRVFLSATKKANKGIRETIKNDAFKFFSYNNGISATAEAITTENNRVVHIQDFQIVNGGQTTATILYSRKRSNSLKDVFVAVKITALKKDDKYASIVSKISQAANTQSSIANSDFYANDKMLVVLEQLSIKNPVQNDLDRNIYYFFERMKGQYNVSKSSRGTITSQKRWEANNPKALMFNKIDLARWSNIMQKLPHIAASGAEKQFKDFMENKNFSRLDMTLSSYKTLIGIGLVFKRIRKLCGSAKGKVYPSLTIDLNTKEHVPVAMSTAIYTASYIHMITEGRLDYWAFYNYKHGLSNSINTTKNRIGSSLDNVFVKMIELCWKQIAIHGGAAAQEKTKNIACWNYLQENISVPNSILLELNKFTISKKEIVKRESVQFNDEDLDYFKALHCLLENNGSILVSLFDIANKNSEYLSEKATLSNLIKKIINGDKLLSKKRIEEVFCFYQNLVNEGFVFLESINNDFEYSIDTLCIYDQIFKVKDVFIQKVYDYIFEDEDSFEDNENLYAKVQEIIKNYEIQYGITIKDLEFLDMVLKKNIS
tara:strand:- start:272 stop:2713 length:2442 start_codon:yes stop_codon:yes gene_type:complete